ncbi:MAG: alpha/beta hydrolase [Oligoflexia bacterium]|nr:alpha/beta hydrolase [Oligoflexia bacterium]
MASLKKLLTRKSKLHPYTLHLADTDSTHKPANRPIIVFVHHYGGSEKTLRRHAELATKLGFDCVTFNLTHDGINLKSVIHNFPRILFMWSAQKSWSIEVTNVLDQLGDRKKIIFAFSGPSACAIRAIASRYKKNVFDIEAYICDSGPFYDPWWCTREMLKELHGMTSTWPRELILAFMMTRWDLNHKNNVRRGLSHIVHHKPDIPILSLQGAKDGIVPPEQISPVFKGIGFTNYNECILEKAGHLTGLKNDPAAYETAVKNFLRDNKLG